MFEYEVKFDPDIDAKNQRIRLVAQMMREMDSVKVFDGGKIVYNIYPKLKIFVRKSLLYI